MKKLKQVSATILLFIFIASCQSPIRGALQLDGNYDEIFFECVQAMNEINFAVVNADKATGFIAGELGSSTSSRTVIDMNVTLRRIPAGVEVKAAIVPRPGAIHIGGRGVEDYLRYFTEALKRKFPNIKIAN